MSRFLGPLYIVTPTAAEEHASIIVNGAPATSVTASGAISLSVGTNTITVVVTAQDTSTKTYTITVIRAAGGAQPTSVNIEITQDYTLGSPPAPAALAATANQLTLTITVRNHGPDDASDVVVADAFPPAAAGSTWSWTCAATGGGTCGAASGTGDLNETLGSLPNGGAVVFSVTGTLRNPASWSNSVTAALPTGVVNSGASAIVSTVGVYRVLLPVVRR